MSALIDITGPADWYERGREAVDPWAFYADPPLAAYEPELHWQHPALSAPPVTMAAYVEADLAADRQLRAMLYAAYFAPAPQRPAHRFAIDGAA